MVITLNDKEIEVDDAATVSSVLDSLGMPDKGIAVAIDWTVLPRSQWSTVLHDGARVEVVTAVQGG